MEFPIAIMLDLIAVCIVLYCAHSAAKKGFARTVIQMLSYLLVVMAASFLSKATAPLIYDRVVRPIVLEEREQSRGNLQNAALVSMLPRGISVERSGLEGLLPENFDLEELAEDLLPEDMLDGLAEELEEATIRPLAISAISMVGFVVLFTILSILANMLLSALGIINHLPLIGPVNALLGGAIGVLEGALIVLVLAVLLRGLLYLHPEGWWIFDDTLVSKTYLFRYFYDLDSLRELCAGLAKFR
ncbi:MAG: hypothetical protein HFG20_01150 [Anaerotruncus sp.]|nr:hypothetical protein [Anaerotruncus sp.]